MCGSSPRRLARAAAGSVAKRLYLGFLAEMGFEIGESGRVLDTMLVSRVLEDKEKA
jgi:hypothetical protein